MKIPCNKKHTIIALSWSVLLSSLSIFAQANPEISGKVILESSAFLNLGKHADQDYRRNNSIALEPEFYWEFGDNDTLVFIPFTRIDEHDDERTHSDIRELLWTHFDNDWEFKAGLGKVFWGVTEFNHLVDIINQTDSVDDFTGEEKLGQPMISASKVTDMGIFDVYLLPGFRERTFVGKSGRLRPGLIVDDSNSTYESGRKDRHLDVALRWSHSIDVYDFGVYAFKGTDRSPQLQAVTSNGQTLLRPHYQQITQWGLDAQATIDNWLLKLEALRKSSHTEQHLAIQSGFEYTFYGINDSVKDLGVLLEYGWDERGSNASSINQNDVSLGGRLTFNNTLDTAILFGGTYDMDYHSKSVLIEASQRLTDSWTINVNANWFFANNTADSVSSFDRDDRVQLVLEKYF